MDSCGSESEEEEDDEYEEEEREKEKEEAKGKKLIRASSILNMKITEKIMVESDEESYENEEWDKKWKNYNYYYYYF